MQDLQLIDVREPHEWAICHIDGARLIPLSELESRMAEIPRDRETVVYCKSGVRSMKAIRKLQAEGYTNLRNMTGGIQAWAKAVDPHMGTC